MTEDKIKEMYRSLGNGDKWECKPNAICAEECQPKCDLCDWRPYELGDEIIPDWEYRKIVKKTWLEEYLYSSYGANAQYYIRIGAKEFCKKILEETKKMWNEDSDYFSDLEGIIKDLGVEV